jgi:hypothetical protein
MIIFQILICLQLFLIVVLFQILIKLLFQVLFYFIFYLFIYFYFITIGESGYSEYNDLVNCDLENIYLNPLIVSKEGVNEFRCYIIGDTICGYN